MTAVEIIVGSTVVGCAFVAVFVVFLVLRDKVTSSKNDGKTVHHLPDMLWYSHNRELADAMLMTFGMVLGFALVVPQLVKNASASNFSELEVVSPFFIVLPPVVFMSKIPKFRNILANNIHVRKNRWAITSEVISLFVGILGFDIWIFQYAIPLHRRGADIVLSISLLVLATLYAVVGSALFYWVYRVVHIVVPADGLTAAAIVGTNLETMALLGNHDNISGRGGGQHPRHISATSFDPFENTTIHDDPFTVPEEKPEPKPETKEEEEPDKAKSNPEPMKKAPLPPPKAAFTKTCM
jgi:hypothetical protein